MICAPYEDKTFFDNFDTFAFVITSTIKCNFTRIADRVMDEQKNFIPGFGSEEFPPVFGQIYFGRLAV